MLKTLIIFLHLLSAAFALVSLIKFDLKMLLNLNTPLGKQDVRTLKKTKNMVSNALWLLWITGIIIVTMGYMGEPAKYLLNEKLWVKVIAVVVLTINGIVLHYYAFPKLKVGATFLNFSTGKQFCIITLAAISSTSWLYASFLGMARAWNYTMGFSFVMGTYLALMMTMLIGSFIMLQLLTRFSFLKKLHSRVKLAAQSTKMTMQEMSTKLNVKSDSQMHSVTKN